RDPDTDRVPLAKRLKEIIALEKSIDTEENRALLKSLELALIPSQAKPGSIEALIDELIDYEGPNGRVDAFGCDVGNRSFSRLAELGFDAVPFLIEHLEDERLTRCYQSGFMLITAGHYIRVGDLVSELLTDL